MAAKQKPKATSINTPTTLESGVQLSPRALYERRVAEIEADAEAGRCTLEEADARTIQALQALYGRVLAPEGKTELGELLRELADTHPALRSPKD
jgi:hypothetical protein